jgi:hypothetical protein
LVLASWGTLTIALVFEGGLELLRNVWSGNEYGHTWVVILSGFTGGIVGMWVGLWLWARLLLKTRFLTKDETLMISGAHWLRGLLQNFENESK